MNTPTIIGPCLLINDECLRVLPTLEAGSVDCVVTDPPYGIQRLMRGGGWANQNVYINDGAAWDVEPTSDATLARVIESAPKAIVWGGNYFTLPPARCWLVWNKPERNFTMAEAELAWTNIEAPVRVIDCPRIGKRPEHPTQKPVKVMQFCIERMSLGETILDPFMGSGTTGVACAQLGKAFTGIERERKYFDIACQRIYNAQCQSKLFGADEDVQKVQPEQAVFGFPAK